MLPHFDSPSLKVGSSGGQYFFFFFKEHYQELCGRYQRKLSLYKTTKNTYAHYFYLAWKLACVSSIVLAFKKNSCAVTVLVYNSLVTSVLHPMSRGAPQSHEMIYHKPPVISGYGNISQALYIDYGFIMSQPGNFSLSSSLKLVSAGKSAVKQ